MGKGGIQSKGPLSPSQASMGLAAKWWRWRWESFLIPSIIYASTSTVQHPIMSLLPPLRRQGTCPSLSWEAWNLNRERPFTRESGDSTHSALLSYYRHTACLGQNRLTVTDSPICLPQEGKIMTWWWQEIPNPKELIILKVRHNHSLLKYVLSPSLHFSISKTISGGIWARLPQSKLFTWVSHSIAGPLSALPTPPHSSGNFTASMPPQSQLRHVSWYMQLQLSLPSPIHTAPQNVLSLSQGELSSETQLRGHPFLGPSMNLQSEPLPFSGPYLHLTPHLRSLLPHQITHNSGPISLLCLTTV